jgi:hypothetical protein
MSTVIGPLTFSSPVGVGGGGAWAVVGAGWVRTTAGVVVAVVVAGVVTSRVCPRVVVY